MLLLLAATHVYVDATLLVNGIFTIDPLQIVSDDVLVIAGSVLTVINTADE